MRPLRALTGRRHLAVWLGLAVVVIGGLLGMHALNLHAQTPHATAAHATTAHDAGGAAHATSDDTSHAALPCDSCGEQPAGHEAAMACVLALLITLLLLPAPRLFAAVVERIRWLASMPARIGVAAAPTRSLYELSVIRT
ncbi:hypothetical protein GCM10009846_22550 [Agrococcus versicolor]|uniref:DUF2946 domain-containing protein n=1 Tax=Agrococcus versicolor TaxID=501482 RepID=A0ABN3AV22_9MICO